MSEPNLTVTPRYVLSAILHAALADPDLYGRLDPPQEEQLIAERPLAQELVRENIARLYGEEAASFAVYLGERVYRRLVERDLQDDLALLAIEAESMLNAARPYLNAIDEHAQRMAGTGSGETFDGFLDDVIALARNLIVTKNDQEAA